MFLFKRQSVLYQYFFTYATICIFTTAFLGGLFYVQLLGNMKRELENANMSKLSQVSDIMDQRMKNFYYTAARITEDQMLAPIKFNGGYSTIEAIAELKKYKAGDSGIEDMFVYIRNANKIYSTSGVMSVQEFQRYFARPDPNLAEFRSLIETSSIPEAKIIMAKMQNSAEVEPVLAVLFPLTNYSTKPYGTLVFLVKEAAVKALIREALGDMEGQSYIFGRNRDIITAYYNGRTVPDMDMNPYLEQYDRTGSYPVTLNGRDYSYLYSESEYLNWRYVSLLPSDQFAGRLVKSRDLILPAAALVVIAGFILAYLIAWVNARSIRKMAQQVQGVAATEEPDAVRNEIFRMGSLAMQAFSHNRQLVSQMEEHREIVKEQTISKLLNGSIRRQDELDDMLAFGRIELSEPYFCVLIIGTDQLNNRQFKDTIVDMLAGELPDQPDRLYFTETLHDRGIAVILNFGRPPASSHDRIRHLARRMQTSIYERTGRRLLIGIGSPTDQISQLNRSFIEASAALEYLLLNGKRDLAFFGEIVEVRQLPAPYAWQEQFRLLQSLKQGDEAVARENIAALAGRISGSWSTPSLLRYIAVDLAGSVIKAVIDIHQEEFKEEIQRLMQFQSVASLEELLYELAGKVCAYVQEKKEYKNLRIKEEILAYVNHQYSSPLISLELLAEQYAVSTSYISRVFKEMAGCTFMEHITRLRMDEVKRKLVETDLSVKDIALQAGYLDIPSFIRKFKNTEGITPGNYRKLYAHR